jgi:hypothetical protein
MRIKVDVTANDIRLGKRKDACSCPVARGIGRALRGLGVEVQSVSAGWQSLEVNDFEFADTPVKASRFIETFDAAGRKAVKPFSFTLNVRKSILEAVK